MTEAVTQCAVSALGKKLNTQYVEEIVAEARSLDPEYFSAWRGGWTKDIELALLDAVLSIQAQYETKNGKGVLPKVQGYRTHRGGRADDLSEFAAMNEAELSAIIGYQRTGRRTKAGAAIEAAANLRDISPTVLDHAIWRSEAQRQSNTAGKES